MKDFELPALFIDGEEVIILGGLIRDKETRSVSKVPLLGDIPLLGYLFVPEKEFRRLRPGQPAPVSFDAIPGEAFDASILRVSPVVDPETGTFKVTVAVTDPANRLKPGMFGRFQVIHASSLPSGLSLGAA